MSLNKVNKAFLFFTFSIIFLFLAACAPSPKAEEEDRKQPTQEQYKPTERYAEATASEEAAQEESLTLGEATHEAFQKGKTLECIYPPGTREEAVTWIKDGKVKTVATTLGEMRQHTLSVQNCFSTWTEGQPALSMRTCYDAVQNVAADERTGEDKNRVVKCRAANISDTVFAVPPDVQFNEVTVPADVELY